MKEYFIRLLAYDDWANRRALKAMNQILPLEPRILALYGHIIAAETIWLNRITGKEKDPPTAWPDYPLESMGDLANEIYEKWGTLLDKITAEDLQKKIKYKNLKGESFTQPVQDIIIHVFNHSTYHRGQINQQLRATGGEPAITDYIVFNREEN